MSQVKRHSYFYPGGPDTVETLLPIPADDVPEKLRKWAEVNSERDLCSDGLMESWLARSASFQGEVSRTLKSWIDTCVPYSVVQFTEWTWIAFKRQGMVDQKTGYGNCVLVPLNEPLDEQPSGFPLHRNPEIEEFVQAFRNICGDIPPTNKLWPADSAPELLRGSQFNVGLQAWEDSLPLIHNGSGDLIVARRDGILGCFEKGGAYSPLPHEISLGQLVEVLFSMFGGRPFDNGDG